KNAPRNVVVKLVRRGCYAAQAKGANALVRGFTVEAVDAAGAGDVFNGAFAAALVEGRDAVSSAGWASAAAAVSVTRHGAQPSMPTRAEVDAFLAQRSNLQRTGEFA